MPASDVNIHFLVLCSLPLSPHHIYVTYTGVLAFLHGQEFDVTKMSGLCH